MRLLFLGDVVGQSGRKIIEDTLRDFKTKYKIDFTVINGDNAAHGFGLTSGVCTDLFNAGADVITSGNHGYEAPEMENVFNTNPRVLRPANFPEGMPGSGCGFYTAQNGKKVGVLHLQGRVFMSPCEDPFRVAKNWAENFKLGENVDALIVDVHGEATSEKMALAQFLDGKVSFVVGTHTHIPTADVQILPNGTAYQTDAGMCGCFDSVIGMKKEEPIYRYLTCRKRMKYEPVKGDATVCGLYVETDDKTGLAVKVSMVRYGGRLQEALPKI